MRVGFLQFSPVFGETAENTAVIAGAVAGAGADLLVAPELATSGYLFTGREELLDLAEPVPGPTSARLLEAVRSSGCTLAYGFAERSGREVYNSAVLLCPGGLLGVYRKAHLFSDEKRLFTPGPGPEGFPVFRAAGAAVGLLVCFDHLFPEAARTLALAGAGVVCHPSNLVLPEYGQLTTRVRALENRVYWILANRYGEESRGGKTLRFTGASQIVAPGGDILARAPADRDAVEVVEIDPGLAADKHVTPLNDLFEDRRTDLYRLG
ncbi:MAG: nitrilase-related carbon-nitrogen hydrolase [Spirochaetota bacterium]